jgi:hypothetical protein
MIDKLKTKINERIAMLRKQYTEYEQEGKNATANERLSIAAHLGMVVDELDQFDDYLETYHEITAYITLALYEDQKCVVTQRYAEQGHGGMYELAEEWTNEFHSLYADREWDGEWLDTITEFFNSKNELT